MSGTGDMWQQAADKWSEVTAQIQEADWDKSTTCAEWNVRELVDHALSWQAMGGGVLGAGTTPGDDWATIQPALATALHDPANLEGKSEAFGGMSHRGVAGMVIGDLLIHAWDLARSIGADETLPEEVVESTLMGLRRLPEKMLRGDTMFNEPIDVPEDATNQEKLLAFVGRQP
ncbi:MAG: TIGR03086 family protein [Acidimicrobiia bacterium]|nr:TIGR03086 family protein [Acidimicrobiia bacterium]RZV44114.1 MAG: TIGR03086 family protein [Acidimicrobiales bacterium]